jgi:hypothetical protein
VAPTAMAMSSWIMKSRSWSFSMMRLSMVSSP